MSRINTFKPKYIKLVDVYLKKAKDKEYTFQKMSGRTDGFEEKVKVKLPTIERYCQFIKVPRQTVYDWIDAHADFKMALDKILVEQKARLMEKGLSERYNPIMAKFLLSANHGLREKSDLTTDEKPIGVFNDEQIDRIAERITSRKGTTGGASSSK